jgi:hypothetical protein
LVAWGVDGRIILNEILNKYCTNVWNGFNWFRIGLVVGSNAILMALRVTEWFGISTS